MFKLASPQQTYQRIVQVPQPQPDGTTRALSFTAQFLLLRQSELRALLTPDVADVDFCRRVLVGWTGIEDPDGAPLAFSDEALLQLCDIPYWVRAVVDDYLAFQRGEPAKN